MPRLPRRRRHLLALPPLALLAACHGEHRNMPGDANDHHPFSGIAKDATVHVTGTEPFWSATIHGRDLHWVTPDKPQGEDIRVSRFAGRGGLSYSGAVDGTPFTMAITPGACTDGMSDRRYPFVVTLQLGEQARSGCAWVENGKASK